MKDYTGTWKATAMIDATGNRINRRVPFKLTFNADGTGKFKFLFLSRSLTWEADENYLTTHGKKEVRFEIDADTLIMDTENGERCVFSKTD